jgi:hypothetical protein
LSDEGVSAFVRAATDGKRTRAVALLVGAGNAIEPRFLEVAEGPLYAWSAARLG